jgi:signal transduction histidine kinase/CheY-like chemotaxis protein
MKIGKKLIILNIILAIAGISVIVGTILNVSKIRINTLVNREINNLAQKEARGIQAWLETYLDAARTMAQIMEQYEQIDRQSRRAFFDTMVKGVIAANPEIICAWSCWEPDALDGLDTVYANTEESDSTGRYLPLWVRNKKGITKYILEDYSTEGAWGNYYLLPSRTGHEVIIEPYWYTIDDDEMLFSTFAVPIKKGGNVIGAVGVDIELLKIQAQATANKPYEGSIAIVYTNGGIISGHFDSSRLGKPMEQADSDIAGDKIAALSEAIKQGKSFSFYNALPGQGAMLFIAVPFTMGKTAAPWTYMMGIPEEIIMDPIYEMLQIGIAISLLTLIVGSTASFIMALSISKPLNIMIKTFKDIGNSGGLSKEQFIQRLPEKIRLRHDEIGQLGSAFIATSVRIRDVNAKIEDLTRAIREGRLRKRADTQGLQANSLRIISSMNTALDVICSQLDKVPEALALFSSSKELLYYNRAMEDFLKTSAIDFVGATILERLLLEKPVQITENSSIYTANIALNSKNYTLSITQTGMEGEGNFMLLLKDVTILIQAKIEAEAASKSKSDFLSRMSHEIRTPINAITGMTQIAKKSRDIDRIYQCLTQVENSSAHLLGVINDILDFSKIEAGKLSIDIAEFSLTEDLDFVVSLMQGQAKEKQINLCLHVGAISNDLIQSDSLRLNQVLINLLSNAIKFSPKESNIEFNVQENMDMANAVNGISTFSFEVKDHGIGINKEQAARLFKPFEQSDGSITRNYGGTGLGLSISKSLIELMGGEINLVSSLGEGSAFSFTINCHARPKPRGINYSKIRDDSDLIEEMDFRDKRCLVVDDIEINREIVMELLSETGIAIETAANGQEAVDKFSASVPGYYDIILMDMQMPLMDGCTAVQKIRAIEAPEQHAIIIAMTANVMEDDVRKALDAGMDSHLGKPIDIKALYLKLQEAFAEKAVF